MRIVWATDIHLNFVDAPARQEFFQSVAGQQPDAVFVSGDIAESHLLEGCLLEMAQALARPIYFVLGNHDFYRGSIAETRARIARLAERTPWLVYLTRAEIVPLTPDTALVGHDGWADARLGDFEHSDVILNDYLHIEELYHWDGLFQLNRQTLRGRLEELGDEAARHFQQLLPQALRDYRRVVLLTHVPPFREACCYAGKVSDDRWLPHFSCGAVGQVLDAAMRARADRELLVLCGHTHNRSEVRILDNLRVLTGAAQYAHPAVEQVFDFA
jgi:predicted MPP superfamily phosphohydrolase